MSPLISAQELQKIIGTKGIVVLDGSYNLPPSSAAIHGAIDFDIDAIADPAAPLAHTLPTPELFGQMVGALGIGNDNHIIVYDRAGMAMAASRVWWMFRVFGHDRVQVLNGGLPAWVAAGGALGQKKGSSGPAKKFAAHYRPELFKSAQDIEKNISAHNFTVLDARDPRRYSGEAAEPRPGMTGGHIPNSINTPFMNLIDPATGMMKSAEEIKKIFSTVKTDKPVAISCGSGVTACVVALGLHLTGHENAAVYGGSWAEWGMNPALPKKTGSDA